MIKRIQIDLDEKILDKFEKIAIENRSSRKQMIEKALEDFCKNIILGNK